MLHTPYYDPLKSYYENYDSGPFGAFADGKDFRPKHSGSGRMDSPGVEIPKYNFLGQPVFLPFGIPAGPLPNSNFVKAAFQKGFDITTYKTVRSHKFPCHPWPNVLAVKIKGNLTLTKAQKPLVADNHYATPLSITNSFGVPSFTPDVWQEDMAKAVKSASRGQVLIASFQGTPKKGGTSKTFIDDHVRTAKLVKETGAKIIEINLSCPNEGTNDLLCFDTDTTQKIAARVKDAIGNIPLILKLAYFKNHHHLEDFVEKLAPITQAFAAINTIPAPIVDKKNHQALPGEGRLRSGVCGAAIKWAGLDMVKRLKRLRDKHQLNFTIIGVGGITKPQDYHDYIAAGADAALSATGSIWHPYLAQEIKALRPKRPEILF